ncbi:MAG: hypothetical protein V4659_00315 [Pseudomonadota bacterium]
MQGYDTTPIDAAHPLQWWQTRGFVVAMALLSVIPLLWPDIPPLVDLPGHMARYRVQLDGDAYPWLGEWYRFQWSLIGNLGVDLLIVPLAQLFGLELAVKLVVIVIPPLTVTGFLWIAREVHGRIPATALFALPLAYSYPFHFGFVNFALSIALALNLFALWLRLARLGRVKLRAVLFVPLSCLLWLCHTFGWGVLGLLAFSAEMIRQHDLVTVRKPDATLVERLRRGHWVEAWGRAVVGCLPLAVPMLLMVLWRTGDHVTGKTADWFNWRTKARWAVMTLRDRWIAFDLASTAILFLILLSAFRDRTIEYSRNLGLSALALFAMFLLLPRIVFGSAYADMRLFPFAVAVAIVALRPRPGVPLRHAAAVAFLGLAFMLVRIGGTTASFWLYDRQYTRVLATLDRVPVGARLLTFVGQLCRDDWTYSRLEHISGMATVRRMAFSNDQWSMPGAQLLTVRYPAGSFAHDPSEIVTQRKCPYERWWKSVDDALLRFPRDRFDYVWMITPPPTDPALLRGLTPLRRDAWSTLYRVDDRTQPRLNGVKLPSDS